MNNDTPADAMKLLPCPFCGGRAIGTRTLAGVEFWSVECMTCTAKVDDPNSKQDAAKVWNTRTTSLAARDVPQFHDAFSKWTSGALAEASEQSAEVCDDCKGAGSIYADSESEAENCGPCDGSGFRAASPSLAALASIEVKSSGEAK